MILYITSVVSGPLELALSRFLPFVVMSDNTRKTSETAQQVKHEAGQRKEQVVDTAKQQAAHAMERAENTSAE